MFIDYVALMLVNLVAGFVAIVTGLAMIFTWPLPGSYNVPFGELSVLFGALFLGAGIALASEWNLIALGVYAVLAGVAAIIVEVRVINLKMTNEPALSGIGFILSGLSGFMTMPVYV